MLKFSWIFVNSPLMPQESCMGIFLEENSKSGSNYFPKNSNSVSFSNSYLPKLEIWMNMIPTRKPSPFMKYSSSFRESRISHQIDGYRKIFDHVS